MIGSHVTTNNRFNPGATAPGGKEKKMTLKEYKEFLINGILEFAGDRFTREYLEKRTTRVLERIYDNC